ncbi:MAG: DUF262 domain-containing HNH endonuclease family protein [Planctomycetaceae bacterium]|nr:DUF262 domain-containing HNH endonuclease family protein [Planctomycetaceae bacterium]
MATMNFNTANQTFRMLFGNGLTYKVPNFQRDYSWEEEQWLDLWEDLLGLDPLSELPSEDSSHYMGYLVLQTSDNKRFTVIDGQQRMTTFSLLVLAVLDILNDLIAKNQEKETSIKRQESLRNSFIGYLDAITLVSTPKLELNRNNNNYFKTDLVPLANIRERGLKASEHLLRKGYRWFKKNLYKFFEDQKKDVTGESLARFLENCADRLFFTVITVSDELNAYKVFETLNARGVRLSSTDLLKNYFFSIVSLGSNETNTPEIEQLEQLWEDITGTLADEKLPELLRIFWNGRNPIVRRTNLYKEIRGKIKGRENVFPLVRDLRDNAGIYNSLLKPHDEHWNSDEQVSLIELKLFGVTSPLSLLLVAYKKFFSSEPNSESRKEFDNILQAISVFSFRFNTICGKQTGEQETLYNMIARKLHAGEWSSAREVKDALLKVYPDNNEFAHAFSRKEIKLSSTSGKKLVRYILLNLENRLGGQQSLLDLDNDNYNIEHILPQNPDSERWPLFKDSEDGPYIHWLGNLTLLEKGKNKDLGNKSYSEKISVFLASNFEITRKIPEDCPDAWNTNALHKRQKWMANQAKTIWKIN